MTITRDQIARLRELLSMATPGPWQTDIAGNWDSVLGDHRHGGAGVACVKASDRGPESDEECESNAKLIVAMRDALPALLDAAEELERAKGRHVVATRDIEFAYRTVRAGDIGIVVSDGTTDSVSVYFESLGGVGSFRRSGIRAHDAKEKL